MVACSASSHSPLPRDLCGVRRQKNKYKGRCSRGDFLCFSYNTIWWTWVTPLEGRQIQCCRWLLRGHDILCAQKNPFSSPKPRRSQLRKYIYVHIKASCQPKKAGQPGTRREARESKGMTEHWQSLVGSRLSLAVTLLLGWVHQSLDSVSQ